MPVFPEAAPSLKTLAQKRMEWLDGLITGRDWIVPERFTIADIILYCCVDFSSGVGQTNPRLGQKPPGVVQARRGPAEREREPASRRRTSQDARLKRRCAAEKLRSRPVGDSVRSRRPGREPCQSPPAKIVTSHHGSCTAYNERAAIDQGAQNEQIARQLTVLRAREDR